MSDTGDKRGFFGRILGKGKPRDAVPAGDKSTSDTLGDSAVDAIAGVAMPASDQRHVADATATATDVTSSGTDGATDKSQSSETAKPRTWLQRLTGGLAKTSGSITSSLTAIFTKRKLDGDSLQDLEDILIQADLGIGPATRICDTIAKRRFDKGLSPEDVRSVLVAEVEKVLQPVAKPLTIDPGHAPHVILVVGVNGAGKTTTIGKLAAQFRSQGHSVMMAAGDTFRAAAIDQLKVWGERTSSEVVARDVGADSAGLAFDALNRARQTATDVLLIDTAGRLQNKQGLMDELDKVVRVLRKLDPTAPHSVLLVLDATTGQNALNQVAVFGERTGVTGLVMTKLDGTARGGILVAIADKFGLPIHAVGVGEGVEDLDAFDARQFAEALAAA